MTITIPKTKKLFNKGLLTKQDVSNILFEDFKEIVYFTNERNDYTLKVLLEFILFRCGFFSERLMEEWEEEIDAFIGKDKDNKVVAERIYKCNGLFKFLYDASRGKA